VEHTGLGIFLIATEREALAAIVLFALGEGTQAEG
jgi:hypothetical protein